MGHGDRSSSAGSRSHFCPKPAVRVCGFMSGLRHIPSVCRSIYVSTALSPLRLYDSLSRVHSALQRCSSEPSCSGPSTSPHGFQNPFVSFRDEEPAEASTGAGGTPSGPHGSPALVSLPPLFRSAPRTVRVPPVKDKTVQQQKDAPRSGRGPSPRRLRGAPAGRPSSAAFTVSAMFCSFRCVGLRLTSLSDLLTHLQVSLFPFWVLLVLF